MKNLKLLIFVFFFVILSLTSALDDSDDEDSENTCVQNGSSCSLASNYCCSFYCYTQPGEEEGTCAPNNSPSAITKPVRKPTPPPKDSSKVDETVTDEPLIDEIKSAFDTESQKEEENRLEAEIEKEDIRTNNTLKDGAIVGGVIDYNAIYKLPFQVTLAMNWPNVPSFCGGVLLNRLSVLTAAHCVSDSTQKTMKNPSELVVRVGLTKSSEPKTAANTYEVKTFYIHPSYFKDDKNDIAILVLKRPVRYSEKVRRACLDFNNDKSNYLIASGYGRVLPTKLDKNNQIVSSPGGGNLLKFAYFQEKRDFDFCHRSFVCLDSYYKNSQDSICQGDSGGPLMRGNKRVIGVASVTVHSSGSDKTCVGPSRYTRLTNHRRFIRAVIGHSYCGS